MWVAVGRVTAVVVLLAFVLLAPLITGIVHADGCNPLTMSADTGYICITTDKASYRPGETVIVTVDNYGPSISSVFVEIVPVPFPSCGYLCPTASGTVQFNGGIEGTVSLRLPDNTTAGRYDVGLLSGGYPQFSLYQDAEVGITVTGQAPVPESSSVLGLLLPALLVGIYVSKRRAS